MRSPSTNDKPSDQHVRYAKLARPRLHEALPRERLFGLLDSMRERHRIVWIASPPGAGKTTLAASYLSVRNISELWYQIDQGDADAPTLFFYLAEAARLLQPELQLNREGAGGAHLRRVFFRDLYAGLPKGTVVVLDNLQDFDWDSSGQLLEFAFAEVPDGVHIIGLSRDAPPPRLARMEMDGTLGVLGWDQLRLDDTEAHDMVRLGGDGDTVDTAWLKRVDGWAAGVAMLRTLKHSPDGQPLEGRDALFRYFAGEILERLPAPSRRTLLLLSCLQGISGEDAAVLTGEAAAARLLNEFYQNRLFVERRGFSPHTYHFHALFREFLQHEARQRLEADERAAFIERAAALLDGQGLIEAAAQLYQEAGASAQLMSLLLNRAPLMLSTGRAQAWREWMSWLPPGVAEGEPWMRYWHGMSLIQLAPLLARKTLVRAASMFAADTNVDGRLLTIAAIIDTYDVEWTDFDVLPSWIAELSEGLEAADRKEMSAETDLRLHSRLALALLMANSASPALAPAAQRSLQLLPQIADRSEQLSAGAILLRYLDSIDNASLAQWLIHTINRFAEDPSVNPLQRVQWYARVARWLSRDGQFEQARELAGAARAIVAGNALDPLMLHLLEIQHLLGSMEIDMAGVLIESTRHLIGNAQVRDNIEFHVLEAQWNSLSGHLDGALFCAEEAIKMSREAGLPAMERARIELFLAACLTLAGDAKKAQYWSAQAAAHAIGHDAVVAQEQQLFLQAYQLFANNDARQGSVVLRETMALHRRRQSSDFFLTVPRLASALAAHALAANIEAEHVRDVIVRQRLRPPARFTPNWPWPVAVFTLGRFDLALNGTIAAPSGKAQHRPLLLLKALLAAGDSGKSQQALVAHLWPDADDAKSALNVTTHRLRKLLTLDQVVLVRNGKVCLAGDLVWSDVAALTELCDRIDALPADAPAELVNQHATDLLGLYRGPFCDGEEDNWLIAARDRFRNRFLAAAGDLGQRLEQSADWPAARSIYLRSLETEPLAETIYRGLMRCAHALGDQAAAFSVYRRCRETLSIVLGHQPSPETEKLAVALGLK